MEIELFIDRLGVFRKVIKWHYISASLNHPVVLFLQHPVKLSMSREEVLVEERAMTGCCLIPIAFFRPAIARLVAKTANFF
jgi:hypothetical protein